jgi:hypothetical protein
VYDYFNTHSFNAADRYAPGFVPPGWQHQFGGNAGGRIFSKNWFWFVNLEDLDGHYKELNHTTNPLLVNAAGTAILPSNCSATAAQCSTAINFLNLQLNRIVDTALTSPTAFAKFDWRPNDFNQLTFEGGAMHRHSLNGTDTETVTSNAGVLGYNGSYTDESRFAKIGYTAVWSGNAVNELRAGWYRDRFSDYEDTERRSEGIPSFRGLSASSVFRSSKTSPLPSALTWSSWSPIIRSTRTGIVRSSTVPAAITFPA